MRSAMLLASFVLAGCRDAPAPAPTTAAPPPADSVPVAADPSIYSQRTVIYMEATSEAIQAERARMPEADFFVMADDLMFYRSTAYEFLQNNGLTVTRIEGRQPLTFMVNGTPKEYDFKEATTLDVIVVYDPNREPRVIAPVDVESALQYFAIQTTR